MYFAVKKANKVSVKKVQEKMLSRCVTHLIFISKAHNFFVSLISNYYLSHKFFNEKFLLFREIKDNEDRREMTG